MTGPAPIAAKGSAPAKAPLQANDDAPFTEVELHTGEKVALEHIANTDQAVIRVPCEDIGREIVIGVTFTCHCYTVAFDPTKHKEEEILLLDSGGRPRVFCPTRYALSMKLPDLVRGLADKKVFQTPTQRNYVYAVPLEMNGGTYAIYFMLQRKKGGGFDLRLTVESAYCPGEELQLRKFPGAIRFKVLAYRVLKKKPVKFGPR